VQLCRKVDVMFVLGGLESANTRKLAELCKKENKLTFHLQNWNELDINILFGLPPRLPTRGGAAGKNVVPINTIGITAGASTPEWIIDEFVKRLKAL